jgi:hypothetical protein
MEEVDTVSACPPILFPGVCEGLNLNTQSKSRKESSSLVFWTRDPLGLNPLHPGAVASIESVDFAAMPNPFSTQITAAVIAMHIFL